MGIVQDDEFVYDDDDFFDVNDSDKLGMFIAERTLYSSAYLKSKREK